MKADRDREIPADSNAAVFAASYLSAISVLEGGVQPLVLGALATSFKFADRDLGYLSAIYTLFGTVIIASSPIWGRRVDWRVTSAIGLCGWIVAMLVGSVSTKFSALLFVFALIGTFRAFIAVPSFTFLGETANPDRAYGLNTVLQGLSAAAIAGVLGSVVIVRYGAPGVFATLALTTATGFLFLHWMPRSGRGRFAGADPEIHQGGAVPIFSRKALPAFFGLLATAMFNGGVVAFFYFVERIGRSIGVPIEAIGFTLSVTALSSILTSSLVIWLGGRVPALVILASATILLVGTYGIIQFGGTVAFFLASLMSSLGWGLAQPSYWAILSKVDLTRRLYSVGTAASGAGAVVVGVAAGPVIENYGYNGLMGFSGALFIAALAVVVSASKLCRKLELT